MRSKKILATFAAASLGFSAASSVHNFMPKTLKEDTLNIPFNSTLACGACVRGGFSYCRTKSPGKKGRDAGDRCCAAGDLSCMFEEVGKAKDNVCATQNQTFFKENKPNSEYYKDRYVMVQKFCMQRQNATACCRAKSPNGKCSIDLRKGQWDSMTLNLTELPFGGSCTYEVKARCGFPKLVVNSTNIDMVVAYKRKDWDNDTYVPTDDDTYSDDETYNPTPNSKVFLEFWLKAKEKKENKNETDDKKCKETKIWVTLTNLLDPYRKVVKSLH
jgi:hypothetical protein